MQIKQLIGGQLVAGLGEPEPVLDPATGVQIAAVPEATREQVEACYPQLRTLLAEKRRLDPAEKLVNAWYTHHRSLMCRESCEVRWGR